MIVAERIRLRAPSRADLPRFVAWLNDPEVREELALYYPLSMDYEEKWYEDILGAPVDERPLVIELREADSWVPVGNCGFDKIDWRNRSGELGIFIGEKSYWSQGYGTEAVRLLVKHGFETLNLNRIFLRVFSSNLRAIRSYEKAGFIAEGHMRQAEYRHGAYKDVILMSVLRSEWDGAQGSKLGT